jgi:hypothetical protein
MVNRRRRDHLPATKLMLTTPIAMQSHGRQLDSASAS